MKTAKNKYLQLALLLCCSLMHISCEYDTIADAPYPDSQIYLPIALDGSTSPGGIYTIDEGASTGWVSPTPGQPMRYDVKKSENRFIIPLGVYRSGFEGQLTTSAEITLSFDTDTVMRLIEAGTLADTEVFPIDKLQMPASINIRAGQNNILFDLITDLDFLRTDAPKKYAVGIRIASSNSKVNPKLTTGIVLVDTKITIPVADFTAQPAGSSTDTYNFTNNSLYWDIFADVSAFTWDFGDGSSASGEINPQHRFAAPGTYDVTLRVRGITGEEVSMVKQVTVN